MTAEISIFPAIESIADFKTGLLAWKPRTDEEAGKFLAMRSLMSGKAGDAAKDAANARLIKKCDTCDVLEFDGFTLKAVRKSNRTYHESVAITKLEAKIEDLNQKLKEAKADLAAAQVKAGFDEGEATFSHWLVQ